MNAPTASTAMTARNGSTRQPPSRVHASHEIHAVDSSNAAAKPAAATASPGGSETALTARPRVPTIRPRTAGIVGGDPGRPQFAASSTRPASRTVSTRQTSVRKIARRRGQSGQAVFEFVAPVHDQRPRHARPKRSDMGANGDAGIIEVDGVARAGTQQ